MKYVVDTSVAFKWVVAESLADKAIRLRDDFRKGIDELLAVDIFPAEIGNAILVAEWRGRISPGQGAQLLADVLNTCPALHVSAQLLPRAYDIAAQFRETVYDCLYVALAEREQCELVTADDKLVRNLGIVFPFITSLASLS